MIKLLLWTSLTIASLAAFAAGVYVLAGAKNSSQVKKPDVSGLWVSAIIKLFPKHKDWLRINPDGTYVERYQQPPKKDQTARGTYKIGFEDGWPKADGKGTQAVPVLNLFMLEEDGKPASTEARAHPRRLIIEIGSGPPMLTDILEEVLTRPEYRQKVIALFKASAPPPPHKTKLSKPEVAEQKKWSRVWHLGPPRKPPMSDSLP